MFSAMALVVYKFGGSSLASPEHVRRAALRLAEARNKDTSLVVVVSAMGQMTNELLDLAHQTVKHPPQRELDMLLTAGERVSMSLLAMALQELEIDSISFTGSQVGIVTNNVHTDARIIDIRPFRLVEALEQGKVAIIAGFQGVSEAKEITTLGRGGSDTTAVAIAAKLGADRCEILTDVDGLFTADPRLVKNSQLLEEVGYSQAVEFSSLGAKMHPRSIELAARFGVKVRISNANDSSSKGTTLVADKENNMEEPKVCGVATKKGFHGFRANIGLKVLVELMEGHRIPLRFFTFNDETVTFLSDKERSESVRQTLIQSSVEFTEIPSLAVVSVVGEGISGAQNLLSEFLKTIHSCNTECQLLLLNALSASAAVDENSAEVITQKLHALWLEK